MGYNFIIGEFVVEQIPKYREALTSAECVAQAPNSPLNSNDDYSNSISPGYIAWDDFASRAGLHNIFYKELLRPHPGCKGITEEHYEAFEQALDRYTSKHKRTSGIERPDGVTETFEEFDRREKTWAGKTEYDFRRLEWLVFWTRWALDNCKYPTFANL